FAELPGRASPELRVHLRRQRRRHHDVRRVCGRLEGEKLMSGKAMTYAEWTAAVADVLASHSVPSTPCFKLLAALEDAANKQDGTAVARVSEGILVMLAQSQAH